MLEASTRLLRLLSLLQMHREWSGPELAERLGVSVRTVRRDVDKLRTIGYPIKATGGLGGGYQMGPGSALPPLLLEEDEALAIVVALRTAAATTVTDIDESAARALAKLHQVLPSRLSGKARLVGSTVQATRSNGATVDSSTLAAIAKAVHDRERLRFTYAPGEGDPSDRDVEPYRVVYHGRRWYLLGWDTARDDWRTFRIDRLTLRVPNGPRFTPRPSHQDLVERFRLGMTTARFRHRAVLTMFGDAQAVAEEVPATIGLVEPIDDRSCTLRIGAHSLDELAVWLAAFGFEFEVHEPAELVDHLRALAGRMERAARRRAAGAPGA